jgi:hypothetical protein
MKRILLVLFIIIPAISYSQESRITFSLTSGIENGRLKQTIESNSANLLQKLNESYKKSSEALQLDPRIISPEGMKAVNELWADGHFYCYSNKIYETLLTKDGNYQVRNIPFIFGKTDSVDVVLDYTADGKVNNLFIGLSAYQYKRVMDVNSVIDQTRRQIILNFIENLRTYYIKKDIDNIKKLYSDKALIIIGKVLEPVNVRVDQVKNNFTQSQVNYIVLTKEEYLSRLQSVFNSSKYLMLEFDHIEVIKHRKYPNFYGVLLQQSWKSSDYSDKGWLFLLVQFKDGEEPLIWVRTWQDVKDTPYDSVFGLHNFVIRDGGKISK